MKPWLLLVLAATATGLGLANLYSATLGADGSVGGAFAVHATRAAVAVLGYTVASRLSLDALRDHARWVWLAGVALLVVTLATGHVAGGARSWLELGPLRLQPSEPMKIALPLVLAAELSRPLRRDPIARAIRRALLQAGLPRALATRAARAAVRVGSAGVLVGVPLALVAAQPDLGAVGLLGLTALAVVWLAGLPRVVWAVGALAGALAAPVGWMVLEPYQRTRILTFLDPAADPSGAGYQTLQSLYAVTSGGWVGRGFATGTQGRLGFLPEHTTDFILAHLAEEWVVLGATLCLALLLALIAGGLSVAERARDPFAALLAGGLSLALLAQVVVNAGGILGLVPLTGVTLPFFSYGGSSLLAVWFTVGLLAAVARSGERRSALLDARPALHARPAPSGV